jgi:hypothetical protein
MNVKKRRFYEIPESGYEIVKTTKKNNYSFFLDHCEFLQRSLQTKKQGSKNLNIYLSCFIYGYRFVCSKTIHISCNKARTISGNVLCIFNRVYIYQFQFALTNKLNSVLCVFNPILHASQQKVFLLIIV